MMESKDWAFACSIDRDSLDTYHDQFVEYVSTFLRRQMADHILDLIQQYDAICIQRSEMTIRNDDARRMVTCEETLRMRPLVLCKDCKWWVREGNDSYGYAMFCDHDCSLGGQGIKKPTDYCSYGERKGGDE